MNKEALEDIRDLAVGYDGFNSIEGLKSLIDDMQNIAIKALKEENHIHPVMGKILNDFEKGV